MKRIKKDRSLGLRSFFVLLENETDANIQITHGGSVVQFAIDIEIIRQTIPSSSDASDVEYQLMITLQLATLVGIGIATIANTGHHASVNLKIVSDVQSIGRSGKNGKIGKGIVTFRKNPNVVITRIATHGEMAFPPRVDKYIVARDVGSNTWKQANVGASNERPNRIGALDGFGLVAGRQDQKSNQNKSWFLHKLLI